VLIRADRRTDGRTVEEAIWRFSGLWEYSNIFTDISVNFITTGVLISPQPDQKGNKLQRRKILSFIYPIYNHNWRNIGTIYVQYITRLASKEIFSQ